MNEGVCQNTDRELWREREGDFYADSVHVTRDGGLGINCGGFVVVKPLREWHALGKVEASCVGPQCCDAYPCCRGGEDALLRNLMDRITDTAKATNFPAIDYVEQLRSVLRLRELRPIAGMNRSSKAEHEAFEAHFKHLADGLYLAWNGERYWDERVQALWEGWAARASAPQASQPPQGAEPPTDWEAAYRQFADGPAFGPEVPALKKAFAAGMAWQASATTNGPAAWQPIETAPKDRAILLGNKHGSWIGKWLPVYVSGYVPDNPWSSLMLNHDHMGEKWHPPTHWQPLYAAPAPDSTRGTP